MRKAVIDIGSNSMRYAIADEEAGRLDNLQEDLKYTRLVDGMDGNGVLSEAKIEEAEMACRYFLRRAKKEGAKEVLVTATSVFRRASNQEAILQSFAANCGGVVPRILSEEEEARYGYLGATDGAESSATVLDIGAGSVEVSWREEDGIRGRSLPYGALWLVHHPEDERALKAALEAWQALALPRPLYGVGGSLTTMVMVLDGRADFDAAAVDCRIVDRHAVQALLARLEGMAPASRAALPGLPVERADSLMAGMRILLEVLSALDLETLTVRTRDSLHGLLASDLPGLALR